MGLIKAPFNHCRIERLGPLQMLPANAEPASHAAEPGARAVVPLKR
jgi:hypothetical protein